MPPTKIRLQSINLLRDRSRPEWWRKHPNRLDILSRIWDCPLNPRLVRRRGGWICFKRLDT